MIHPWCSLITHSHDRSLARPSPTIPSRLAQRYMLRAVGIIVTLSDARLVVCSQDEKEGGWGHGWGASRGAAHVRLHRQGRPFASPLSTHWPRTPPIRSRAAPARSWRRGRAQRCALLPARLPARPPWSAPPPPLSHWPAPIKGATSGATAALGPLHAEVSADPTCVCSAEGLTTHAEAHGSPRPSPVTPC
jgi:hypothetical protein